MRLCTAVVGESKSECEKCSSVLSSDYACAIRTHMFTLFLNVDVFRLKELSDL